MMNPDGEDKPTPNPAQDPARPSDEAGDGAAAVDHMSTDATATGDPWQVPFEAVPRDADVPQLITSDPQPQTAGSRLRKRLRGRRAPESSPPTTPAPPADDAPALVDDPAADEAGSNLAPSAEPVSAAADDGATETAPAPSAEDAPSLSDRPAAEEAGSDLPVPASGSGQEATRDAEAAVAGEAIGNETDLQTDLGATEDAPDDGGPSDPLDDWATGDPFGPVPAPLDETSGPEERTLDTPSPATTQVPEHAGAHVQEPVEPDDRGPAEPDRSAGRRQHVEAQSAPPRAQRVSRSARPRLVAEPDDNRLAQRIEGNGTVMISDELYALHEWSLAGLTVPEDTQIFTVGDRRTLELEIDLGDYAVNLDIEGEVLTRAHGRISWRFVAPTDTQRQVLRSLAKACLTGRPTDFTAGPARIGGFRPTATSSGSSTSPFPPQPRRRSGRFAGILSLPLNAVVIALTAGAVIYMLAGGEFPGGADEDAGAPPVIRARDAAVAVPRIDINAPFAGTIIEWSAVAGEQVDQNEQLLTMLTDNEAARRVIIKSPCNCTLTRINTQSGDLVARQESLGSLYARGSAGAVHALFAPGEAPALGDTVSVSLPYSGAQYAGEVAYVGEVESPDAFIGLPVSVLLDSRDSVFVRIRTDPALPAAQAGDPAMVTFSPAPTHQSSS